MSSREHPLFTIKNDCQDCYKCVRECPVKAIKIEDNSAQIVPELCVACGKCYKVCPVRAKQDRDDVPRAKNMLAAGERVYVSLAPSWIAEFDNVTKEQLLTAMEKLGFAGVSETALGAEEVSAHLADFLADKKDGVYLSTACPAFVEYINKYLLPQLRNAAVCTVRMKQQPEEQVSGLDTEEKCTGDLKIADCIRMADTLKVDDTTLFNRIGKVGISSSYASRPLLSVKTNLLSLTGITPEGGLASFRPNLALEFFFARYWSVTASAEYSYWKGGKNKEFWGISGYSLEPRLWLKGDGRYRWFYLGVYGQSGDFDYRPSPAGDTDATGRSRTGRYRHAGLSAGVYVPLSRHWGIEAGVRGGYLHSSAKAYDNEPPHAYYHHPASFVRWGLTGINLGLGYRF